MLFHPMFRDVLAKESIVAFLQSGEVIPDHTRDSDLLMQTKIALGSIESILVGFANLDYAWHSFKPWWVEDSVGVAAPRLTLYILIHLFEHDQFYALYP